MAGNGSLVAAFDGGFQYKDGAYGMIVGSKTYLPLKTGIGTPLATTMALSKSSRTVAGRSVDNVAFVRQNCPILG